MEVVSRMQTERLVLNHLVFTDIALLVQYASNKNLSKYNCNLPFPYATKDAIGLLNSSKSGWRNESKYVFAVRLKEEREVLIGVVQLQVEQQFFRAEFSGWIAEPYWNRGFATEALYAMLSFGFDSLHLHKITASHITQNKAAGKMFQKAGLVKEGELREHICNSFVFQDLFVYGLTKHEYWETFYDGF